MESLEKIDHNCLNCGIQHGSYINVLTGDIEPKFCSDECGEEYYKNKNICEE